KTKPSITAKQVKEKMVQEGIPPQLQDQIQRLQQVRSQVQMIAQQRQQIELQLKETEEALKEIENTTDKTPIYKSVGAILIKTKGKNEIKKELSNSKESLELRKTTLEKQEGRTREKLNELQSKVENALNLAGKEASDD
ncbi:MAG: prefoldin subunit beta, partial [Thermoplasmatota archaeon]